MSAYSSPVTPLKDVSKYFHKDEKTFSLKFIGKSLELRIPKRFETYGALLNNGETVTTLGICDMIIDDKYQAGLNLLASITIQPSEVSQMNYEGVDYLVLKLREGDVFMTSTRVLQDPNIVYILWTEFVTNGHLPYFHNYPSLLAMFENVKALTGSGLGVSRSVYEGIIARLARDRGNISKQYRLTSMTRPMKFVALNSISQSTENTSSKLIGSYFRNEGMTSALRRQVDEQQPFENILRGLPTKTTN